MEDNIKILEKLLVDWNDRITNLINIEAILFIRNGQEEIENKIEEAKSAFASRGVKYGFKYEDIAKKYGLDENYSGNLLGDYKNNLVSLNNIYKKAYKAVVDAKLETLGELKKILKVILTLQKSKMNLSKTSIEYQKHELKLRDLTKKVKDAINDNLQNEALQISKEINIEKENNPLKEYNNRLKLFISQIAIYEGILKDCESKLNEYYEERNKKFEKTILIEPVEGKALTIKKKSFFNRK